MKEEILEVINVGRGFQTTAIPFGRSVRSVDLNDVYDTSEPDKRSAEAISAIETLVTDSPPEKVDEVVSLPKKVAKGASPPEKVDEVVSLTEKVVKMDSPPEKADEVVSLTEKVVKMDSPPEKVDEVVDTKIKQIPVMDSMEKNIGPETVSDMHHMCMCIGWVNESNVADAPTVLAVCARPPDGRCPAVFDKSSCVVLEGASVAQDVERIKF